MYGEPLFCLPKTVEEVKEDARVGEWCRWDRTVHQVKLSRGNWVIMVDLVLGRCRYNLLNASIASQ